MACPRDSRHGASRGGRPSLPLQARRWLSSRTTPRRRKRPPRRRGAALPAAAGPASKLLGRGRALQRRRVGSDTLRTTPSRRWPKWPSGGIGGGGGRCSPWRRPCRSATGGAAARLEPAGGGISLREWSGPECDAASPSFVAGRPRRVGIVVLRALGARLARETLAAIASSPRTRLAPSLSVRCTLGVERIRGVLAMHCGQDRCCVPLEVCSGDWKQLGYLRRRRVADGPRGRICFSAHRGGAVSNIRLPLLFKRPDNEKCDFDHGRAKSAMAMRKVGRMLAMPTKFVAKLKIHGSFRPTLGQTRPNSEDVDYGGVPA